MEKILTLIIPTYNMEKYLSYCLDSLIVDIERMKALEVLVVNDGSQDDSLKIAREYECKYPQTFRVVDKENGNYGSCVNRGLKEAAGKYVKVLDADDSFDTDNFCCFLDFLQNTDADLVVSDFVVVDEDKNITRIFVHELPYGILSIDDVCTTKDFSHIQMHAVTYRRSILFNLSYKQTEGISYTDQEWVFTPMVGVKSVCHFKKCVYKYLVGREGQTMNPSIKAKRISHTCQCVYAMGRAYEQYKHSVSEQLRLYFHGRLYYMIKEVYVSCFLNYSDQNKMMLKQFDATLRGISKEAYEVVGSGKFNYIAFWRSNPNLSPVLVRLLSQCYIRYVVKNKIRKS